MFLPTAFKLTSRKPFITCCSIYTTKTPAPHLLFHSFFSVNLPIHSISRLSLYFLETCSKSEISQMDVDILHPPISLLSSLTSSPAHSSFQESQVIVIWSSWNFTHNTSRFIIPLLPLPFQVQPRVPVFKIR